MDKIQTAGAPAPDTVSMVAGLRLHWHTSVREIDPQAWDALLAHVPGGRPFLMHEWLLALETTGCAAPETGWQTMFLALYDAADRLLAACPAYLKSHSYGEYVFDWAWANAHDQALAATGRRYFPKLLSASPFSPIPGQRLLVHPELPEPQRASLRQALLDGLRQRCLDEGWSSAHVLFASEDEAALGRQAGWLVRHGVQFHWSNRHPEPYASFDEFLSTLHRDKRKKILQERRKVAEAGVQFRVIEGHNATPDDWAFFERCYEQTYLAHGQRPYLSRDFWQRVGLSLAPHWVMFVASQDGTELACSLLAVDRAQGICHGRYWGALGFVKCLHFEACYYQPLMWCIEQRMRSFEGGAQGEHKLARGLLPVGTQSMHWLAHEGLRQAVADFLMREDQGVAQYVNELDERKPFKPQD